MKKFTLLFALSLAATTSFAQTYSLDSLTAGQFAAGGEGTPWSFELYTQSTRTFSKLTTYGDSCMANFLDIYNPERLQGNRITEIDGVTSNGNNTWASNMRKAWYNVAYDGKFSADKIMYVAQDKRDGFGYELYGLKQSSTGITFTAPKAGYYTVKGQVCREDNGNVKPLYITPLFRFASQTDKLSGSTMLAFAYGANGGELADFSGKGTLDKGAEQRYVAQQPSEFTMSINLKEGDKLTFVVDSVEYNDRLAWARTFMQHLDISATTQTEAEANSNYVNPYATNQVQALQDLMSEYTDKLYDIEGNGLIGTEVGQYSQEQYNAMSDLLTQIDNLVGGGDITDINAGYYLNQMKAQWQKLMDSKVAIDYTAHNNYLLFHTTGSADNGDLKITALTDLIAANDDNPFGFYQYDGTKGTYTKFPNYGTDSKGKSHGNNAWYNSTGDWYYITEDGYVHPKGNQQDAAIVFTAPEDGVYLVHANAYRVSPNAKVENPLTLTSRFLQQGALEQKSTQYIVQKQYGSVANDGMQGKAPVDYKYFVNLKKGDRITVEVGAPSRNSSAETHINELAICSRAYAESVFTVATATKSGEMFYNPYKSGNADSLRAAVTKADDLIGLIGKNVGAGDGQYDSTAYAKLDSLISVAKTLISKEGDESATQVLYDETTDNVLQAITTLSNSRKGFHITINGSNSIRLAGTDKRLTRKNMADGGYYYSAFLNADGVTKDATKQGIDASTYNWTFIFTPSVDDPQKENITDDMGHMTADAYIVNGVDYSPSDNAFEFLTKEQGDTTFAIKRADGLYWDGNTVWKNPYDKIVTNSQPQYIFVVDQITLTGITNVNSDNNATVKSIVFYTLDGRKVSTPRNGVMIQKQTLSNGSVKVRKVVIR